jgi:lipopolysaccharide export LptBFGC system permease protein LptF
VLYTLLGTVRIMKRITTMILCFLLGFFGVALFIDTPEILLMKSKVLFGGVLIATILKIIDDVKSDR